MAVSCKTVKDNNVVNHSTPQNPTTGNLKNKFDGEIVTKESIAISACRVKGVVIEQKSQKKMSLVIDVTSFLGEGASFNTYRPSPGDKIEVKGLKPSDYKTGDIIKIEIQTLPENPDEQIQKVGLIKILDL